MTQSGGEGGRLQQSTLGRAALAAFALAVLGMGFAWIRPACPSAALLRVPCPGCGLTRATLALARGELATAMGYQPLAPVVAPLGAVLVAWAMARYVLDGRVAVPRWLWSLVALVWVSLVAVWLARMFGAFGGPVPLS